MNNILRAMILHCSNSYTLSRPSMLRFSHRFVAGSPPSHPMRHSLRTQSPMRSLRHQYHYYLLNRSLASKSTPTATIDDDEIPFIEYSHELNAAYWSTRPISVLRRLLEVSTKLGGWFATGRIRGSGLNSSKARIEDRAESLRQILTDLGPAFIKIGQAVSSRPDTLPPEFLKELEKLQDRLPPFPTDQALAVIEAELGVPVNQVFSSISPEPVAAASLGQVYKATLKKDGYQVAVKVQRPGVKKTIALDVLVIRQLLAYLRRVRKFNTDLPALLDEWAASLFRELDYCLEAANGIKFAELYSHLEGVYVPKMVTDLTTPKVLVMEWVDGVRLRTAYSAVEIRATKDTQESGDVSSSSMDEDLRLVEIGVRCSLEQLLEYGFYHADPHPGNLLKTKDGKLAYLDFGMCGQVDESIRQGLIRATLHLVNREYESLADDFVVLGMLPKDSDKSKIVPALTRVFQTALEGGVNNLSFGQLSGNLGRTMYEFNFQIPSYYTLLVRSLSVLEGIALASDKNYKVLGAAYPYIARRLLTDSSPELRSTLMALLYSNDGKFNFKRMESLLTQAARPTGRPQRRREDPKYGAQEAPRGDALALILSPSGDFVRGIIVEELAKGVDAVWRLGIDSVGMDGTALKLADEDDAEQVEGLRRLFVALQAATVAQREAEAGGKKNFSTWIPEVGNMRNSSGSTTSSNFRSEPVFETKDACGTIKMNVEAAIDLLLWALREAETLGPDERSEGLKLPLQVAQSAASRALARALRWFLSSSGPQTSST